MDKHITMLLDQIQQQQRLKIGSFIVTCFGDALPQQELALNQLQSILAGAGFEAGAVRTALSRLVAENWLQRRRDGRSSRYRFSEVGQRRARIAEARIYALPAAPAQPASGRSGTAVQPATSDGSASRLSHGSDQRLRLIMFPRGSTDVPREWLHLPSIVALGNGCWLAADAGPDAAASTAIDASGTTSTSAESLAQLSCAVFSGELSHMPLWVRERVAEPATAQRFIALQQQFQSFAANVPDDPDTALLLRLLLIHEWRRLVLRVPVLPAHLFPPDWPQAACHRFVARLYRSLLPASQLWVATHTSQHNRAQTAPEFAPIAARFGITDWSL